MVGLQSSHPGAIDIGFLVIGEPGIFGSDPEMPQQPAIALGIGLLGQKFIGEIAVGTEYLGRLGKDFGQAVLHQGAVIGEKRHALVCRDLAGKHQHVGPGHDRGAPRLDPLRPGDLMAEASGEFGEIFRRRPIATSIGRVLEARIPYSGADVARHLAGNPGQRPKSGAKIIAAQHVIEIEYGDFNVHALSIPCPQI